MIIHKDRNINDLAFPMLPYTFSINGDVELSLEHYGNKTTQKYLLTPTNLTPRYINLDANLIKDELEVGRYNYCLKSVNTVITRGILQVVRDLQVEIITPVESPENGDSEVIFYNGE